MPAFAILLAAVAAHAAPFDIELRPGQTLQARVDGDLDGDGMPDTAWLTESAERRVLQVHVTDGVTEALNLDLTPLGPGELSIKNRVLVFHDLTGGTTAIDSTRRYRYIKDQVRFRLIGYDASLYSRTEQHDGFDVSWNLLTSAAVVRRLHLNTSGKGDALYDHVYEHKVVKRSPPVWLSDTPAPDDLLNKFRGG